MSLQSSLFWPIALETAQFTPLPVSSNNACRHCIEEWIRSFVGLVQWMDLTLVGSEATVNRTLQGFNTGISRPRVWPVESATVAHLVDTLVRSQEMDTLFCLVQLMELTRANGKPCRVSTLCNRRSSTLTSTVRSREAHMQSFRPVRSGIEGRIASTSLWLCDLAAQCDLVELERHKKPCPPSIPHETTDPDNTLSSSYPYSLQPTTSLTNNPTNNPLFQHEANSSPHLGSRGLHDDSCLDPPRLAAPDARPQGPDRQWHRPAHPDPRGQHHRVARLDEALQLDERPPGAVEPLSGHRLVLAAHVLDPVGPLVVDECGPGLADCSQFCPWHRVDSGS
ncbi:hypothetical protein BC567DRAFT_98273 [Phyllosticta citribraziliensis]